MIKINGIHAVFANTMLVSWPTPLQSMYQQGSLSLYIYLHNKLWEAQLKVGLVKMPIVYTIRKYGSTFYAGIGQVKMAACT